MSLPTCCSGSFGDSSVGEDKAVTEPLIPTDPTNDDQPAHYEFITENVYLTERQSSKEKKKAKKMICDCIFYEEEDDPSEACGSSCLNRLLMIEWYVCTMRTSLLPILLFFLYSY